MTQTQTKWTIGIASDLVVVGHNYEAADMDNPTGAIVRERFHLEATNDFGDRKVTGCFIDAQAAEAAIALAAPVTEWAESYPVYGSEAYVVYGEEELQAWEARHQEWEEWFPGDRYARF